MKSALPLVLERFPFNAFSGSESARSYHSVLAGAGRESVDSFFWKEKEVIFFSIDLSGNLCRRRRAVQKSGDGRGAIVWEGK